jgi:uncharacterized protein (DUF1499 family)
MVTPSFWRRWLKRIALIVAVPIALLASLMAIEALFQQPMGLFKGRAPGLGVVNGRFQPCSWRPNCVSSHADTADVQHFFPPMPYEVSDADAQRVIGAMLGQLPNVRIVSQGGGYFRAEAKSPRLGFVDDVEVFVDGRARSVYVRSASRLGIRDFGVNRARMEALKGLLANSLVPPRQRVTIDMDKAEPAPPVTVQPRP